MKLTSIFKTNKRLREENEYLKELVIEMSGYFPCCIGCDGKTTSGERTEKCVYVFGDTDEYVGFCAKRGIENISKIVNENKSHIQNQNNNLNT